MAANVVVPCLSGTRINNFACAGPYSALPVAHALRRAADDLISAGDTMLQAVVSPAAAAAAPGAAPRPSPRASLPAHDPEELAQLESTYEATRELARTVLHACAAACVFCAAGGADTTFAASDRFTACVQQEGGGGAAGVAADIAVCGAGSGGRRVRTGAQRSVVRRLSGADDRRPVSRALL
jgi:hypothetical protein